MTGTEPTRTEQTARATREARGVGLGVRWEFVDALLDGPAAGVDFVELSPENYVGRGGYYDDVLDRVAGRWPVLSHGLSLSLAGTSPFDAGFLARLRAFLDRVGAPFHSDHLCFGEAHGVALHDLLPVAFQHAEVRRIADRVRRVADALGRPVAVENISYYLHPGVAEMTEADFLAELCEAADCGLMLDVNNAYVNATNFGFDVDAWMARAPLERVVQIHVAGHDWYREGTWEPVPAPRTDAERRGALIVDTHGADVPDPVLALLSRVLRRTGDVPVLLERDQAIPELPALLDELSRVRAARDAGLAGRP